MWINLWHLSNMGWGQGQRNKCSIDLSSCSFNLCAAALYICSVYVRPVCIHICKIRSVYTYLHNLPSCIRVDASWSTSMHAPSTILTLCKLWNRSKVEMVLCAVHWRDDWSDRFWLALDFAQDFRSRLDSVSTPTTKYPSTQTPNLSSNQVCFLKISF